MRFEVTPKEMKIHRVNWFLFVAFIGVMRVFLFLLFYDDGAWAYWLLNVSNVFTDLQNMKDLNHTPKQCTRFGLCCVLLWSRITYPTALSYDCSLSVKQPWKSGYPDKINTSNGSWCIGIKGEMSGTVCVTFTWDIYIYELFIAFVCFVVCSLL